MKGEDLDQEERNHSRKKKIIFILVSVIIALTLFIEFLASAWAQYNK